MIGGLEGVESCCAGIEIESIISNLVPTASLASVVS